LIAANPLRCNVGNLLRSDQGGTGKIAEKKIAGGLAEIRLREKLLCPRPVVDLAACP